MQITELTIEIEGEPTIKYNGEEVTFGISSYSRIGFAIGNLDELIEALQKIKAIHVPAQSEESNDAN